MTTYTRRANRPSWHPDDCNGSCCWLSPTKSYCIVHWYGIDDGFQVYGPFPSYADTLAYLRHLDRQSPDTQKQLMLMQGAPR